MPTTSMANSNTFTCFPSLPFEIRELIWKEALSVPALWATHRDPHPENANRPCTMIFIGPAPYLVGISCKEARRVMEISYIQFDSLRGGPSAFHWVNVDNTVVFFDSGSDIATTFSPEECAQFKHIALGSLFRPVLLDHKPPFPNMESLMVGPIETLRPTARITQVSSRCTSRYSYVRC